MNEGSNPARPATRSHWAVKVLFVLLGLLAITILLAVATLLFGLHTGEEFAPHTFSRRTYYYYEIPLLGFQVTPITRDDTTNSFERYLRSNGFVTPAGPSDPRWDLVYATRSGKVNFRGDAEILCSYLDASNQDDASYWKLWSAENTEAAKFLWPLVARLARRQLYILTPELIDVARSESKPKRLQHRLNSSLARQLFRLGQTEQELGNHETAIELLDEALVYAPEDPDILRCRDASRLEVDRAEDDAADGQQGE